jgi:hypothetical protein
VNLRVVCDGEEESAGDEIARYLERNERGADAACVLRRRRCCAGTATSSRAAGRIRTGVPAGRRSPAESGTSSCGSQGRTRAGVPPDPGRAGRPRSQARREHRLVDPEGGKDRAGAEAAREKLGRVPTSASGEHPRVRLPHRRHALPEALLRAVFIELATPRVHLAGITTNPDGRWVTQQACNLLMELGDKGIRPRFLVRDRDRKFTCDFDEVFRSEGVRVIKAPVQAPNARAHVERAALQHHRPNRSLDQRTPLAKPPINEPAPHVELRSSISSAVATGSAACCASTESLRSRPLLESDAHTPRGRAHPPCQARSSLVFARARETRMVGADKADSRGPRGIRAGPGSSSDESRTEFSAPTGANASKGLPPVHIARPDNAPHDLSARDRPRTEFSAVTAATTRNDRLSGLERLPRSTAAACVRSSGVDRAAQR